MQLSKPNSTFSGEEQIARNKKSRCESNAKGWYLEDTLGTNQDRSYVLLDQTKTAIPPQCNVLQPRQAGEWGFDNFSSGS